MEARILVVDDEFAITASLELLLRRQGYEVETCDNGERALELLGGGHFDLMLADLIMRPIDGLALLRRARELQPHLAVIMMTGFASAETAVESMKAGAFDYVTKPFRIDELLLTVERALSYQSMLMENQLLKQALSVRYHCRELVGESPRMQHLYELMGRLAKTRDHVCILGESGTGKDLVARALHLIGPKPDAPLIELPCAMLAEADMEERLFGQSKHQREDSAFLQARHGSLVLADISALSLGLQYKLVHYLRQDEGATGPNRPKDLDVRLVVTTSTPLEDLVARGQFSPELYHYLNFIALEVPPLRERSSDIAILARHFLNQIGQEGNRYVGLAEEALLALEAFAWPGNVAQLRQVLLAAAGDCPDNVIHLANLPANVQQAGQQRHGQAEASGGDLGLRCRSLRQFLKEQGQQYASQVLQRAHGDPGQAARLLGMTDEEFHQQFGHLLGK